MLVSEGSPGFCMQSCVVFVPHVLCADLSFRRILFEPKDRTTNELKLRFPPHPRNWYFTGSCSFLFSYLNVFSLCQEIRVIFLWITTSFINRISVIQHGMSLSAILWRAVCCLPCVSLHKGTTQGLCTTSSSLLPKGQTDCKSCSLPWALRKQKGGWASGKDPGTWEDWAAVCYSSIVRVPTESELLIHRLGFRWAGNHHFVPGHAIAHYQRTVQLLGCFAVGEGLKGVHNQLKVFWNVCVFQDT